MGRVGTVFALSIAVAIGAFAIACGDSNGDKASPTLQVGSPSNTTPDPVTTQEGLDVTQVDAGATPDSVDPARTSTVAIDANPQTPEVDSAATVSGEFTVAYDIVDAAVGYNGYQWDIEWSTDNLEFVSVKHISPDGLTLCPQTNLLSPQRILGACAQPQLIPTEYEGQMSLITLRCKAPGEVKLHIRYLEGAFGTKIITETPQLSTNHSLKTSDATITCQ